jgi:biotin carboxyl carrier protein
MMRKFNVTVNGKSYAVEVEEVGSGAFTYTPQPVQQAPAPQPVQQTSPVQQAPAQEAPKAPKVSAEAVSGELISAPMPGTILDIKVGQTVKVGELLLILEAMKMENEIVSPKNGRIARVHTSKGASVSTGEPLVTIE